MFLQKLFRNFVNTNISKKIFTKLKLKLNMVIPLPVNLASSQTTPFSTPIHTITSNVQ